MSEANAVRDRLRDQPLPGEAEAAARSWPVVEAALAERTGADAAGRPTNAGAGLRSRRPLVRLALVAALLAAGLGAALSPAGAAVGDWIGDRFTAHDAGAPRRPSPRFRRAARCSLSRRAARMSFGPTAAPASSARSTDAGWSPRRAARDRRRGSPARGRGAGRGHREVVAHRPHGRRMHPAWSTGDGFAVAYLEGAVA